MKKWNPEANEIFALASEIADQAKRRTFVEERCGANQTLKHTVESLLGAYDEDPTFLNEALVRRGIEATSDGAEIAPGRLIGPYKLLQKIGEGGFGVVYLAEQKQPVRRKLALKIIKAGMDTREVVARFEAERQALALMDHPGIAKVIDGGCTEGGRPYFVMELVKGVPITEFCDANKLATEDRLRLFLLACKAVQHAHQKGVILICFSGKWHTQWSVRRDDVARFVG